MKHQTLAANATALALAGFEIGAIKVNFKQPFQWASGTWNPFYNDNRMFLFYPKLRKLIVKALMDVITSDGDCFPQFIAGTATAGIPHGALLAHELDLPFVYIRDKKKGHGKMNRIEGIDGNSDLGGIEGLVIEDLISTGGSSASAVDAVQKANGKVIMCNSLFNYGLPKADDMFSGKIPFGKDEVGQPLKLDEPCQVVSLLYFNQLFKIGVEKGYIKQDEVSRLQEWIADQENWGDNNGFPRVKK